MFVVLEWSAWEMQTFLGGKDIWILVIVGKDPVLFPFCWMNVVCPPQYFHKLCLSRAGWPAWTIENWAGDFMSQKRWLQYLTVSQMLPTKSPFLCTYIFTTFSECEVGILEPYMRVITFSDRSGIKVPYCLTYWFGFYLFLC